MGRSDWLVLANPTRAIGGVDVIGLLTPWRYDRSLGTVVEVL